MELIFCPTFNPWLDIFTPFIQHKLTHATQNLLHLKNLKPIHSNSLEQIPISNRKEAFKINNQT